MDEVFKALADPSRRRLLDSLNERNGQTLRELCAGLAMARQSVSKHLAVLEATNLVSTERRGREKLHFLNPEPINAIADRWMTRYDRVRATALADLKHALEQQSCFVYRTYIDATPERIWTALTDPAATKRYWAELEDATVVVADRPRRLSYTWQAKAAAEPGSKVIFDIEPVDGITKLTVTHDVSEPGNAVPGDVREAWPSIIASLKTMLETGEPLRRQGHPSGF
jgi:DNA-binding transcriptional ArsR family regulator/uncharacterized protein YndB with AHSA1/START domain